MLWDRHPFPTNQKFGQNLQVSCRAKCWLRFLTCIKMRYFLRFCSHFSLFSQFCGKIFKFSVRPCRKLATQLRHRFGRFSVCLHKSYCNHRWRVCLSLHRSAQLDSTQLWEGVTVGSAQLPTTLLAHYLYRANSTEQVSWFRRVSECFGPRAFQAPAFLLSDKIACTVQTT